MSEEKTQTVKRLFVCVGHVPLTDVPDSEGRYVLFHDYEKIEEELRSKQDTLDTAIEQMNRYGDIITQMSEALGPREGEHNIELAKRVAKENDALRARVKVLEDALKPFAKIKPSSLYPSGGEENEPYVVTLKAGWGNPAEFTGKNLADARNALNPQTA